MKTKTKLISLTLVAVTGIMFAFSGCNSRKITLETYSEPFDIHSAEQNYYLGDSYDSVTAYARGLEELSRPQPVTLKWTDTASSDVYTVEISETETFTDKLTYTVSDKQVSVYNLKISTDYYWRVTSGSTTSATGTFSTVSTGPRNLYIDGITNVRDLGGYNTISGERVVQGLLIRGGRLNKSDVNDDNYATLPEMFVPEITESGANVFANELKIKTEIDFRIHDLTKSGQYRNGYPIDVPLKSAVEIAYNIQGINYYSIEMNGGSSMLTHELNVPALKIIMELLSDKSNYPVYYHCNIGTDRTGLLSYLLNALCGVAQEDLYRDYLFSNFGTIGGSRELGASNNTFMTQLDDNSKYAGTTLQERVESYFKSIGVSESTYSAVRDIMLGRV